MSRLFNRTVVVLIPLACLMMSTCGDEEDNNSAVTVPCGTCAAGTVHTDKFLIGGDDTIDIPNPFVCYDSWHADEAPSCVITAEIPDVDACPFETEPGVAVVTETTIDSDQIEHNTVFCPVPRLDAPLDCDEASVQYPADTADFGWYYCQNNEDSCMFGFRFTEPTAETVFKRGLRVQCAECSREEEAGVDCVIDSQVVGQQCSPTDFTAPDYDLLAGANFSLEQSDECGGGPCLTRLDLFELDSVDVSRFDFCTCRCGDLEGNDHTSNQDLCQCPGDSVCKPICDHEAICPEAMQGSFCMPTCTASPCDFNKTCTPPAGGDPWNWSCEE